MARLLIPILIVTLAPAVVIPLGLSKGFQFRQLINYNRLVDGVGRLRFLALIDRNKLRKLLTRSKHRAVLTWSKLLRLANRVKSLKLTCPAEIGELISRLRFPRVFSRSTFSEMMGHFSLLSRTAWSKLHDLIDRTELTGLVSRRNVSGLVDRIKFSLLREADPSRTIAGSAQLDLSVLNCRVQLTKRRKNDSIRDVFTVEICGSIRAPSDMHYTTLRASIEDVTDGPHKAVPVQARTKRWQTKDSPAFCYSADLGKLPNQVTTLSDWMAVARLNLDWLMFPRRGQRDLQFTASVVSEQTGKELGTAKYTFSYENPTLGYIDLRENVQRKKKHTKSAKNLSK